MGIRRVGIDRRQGIARGLGLRLQYMWIKPSGASATSVHAAIDISAYVAGTAVTTSTGFTNPDYPRPLSWTLTDANSSCGPINILAIGTLRDGSTVRESVTTAGTGTQTVTGSVPFATVAAQVITPLSGAPGAADTLSTGVQVKKLGMPWDVRDTSDIKLFKKGTFDAGAGDSAFAAETVAALDVANQVITTTTNTDGTVSFFIEVQSELGLISGQGDG